MLFTTLEFVALFAITFGAHWWFAGRSAMRQNVVLLAASLVFYGWNDMRFLLLLAVSASMNFVIGKALAGTGTERMKSLLFWFGVAINLGVLGFFKYFDFFQAGFVDLVHLFGSQATYDPLNLLLPLGVSFFTFSSVGYLIDVRNEAIEPSRDPLAFFTWTFFFPKMLAGPIDRAQHFLPQVSVPRTFDAAKATDGCRQVLWGLFVKVVIADNCARLIDPSLANYRDSHGSTLLICSYVYLIQLYADFSGYSHIALGVARLLGVELSRNFSTPLFATGIADFWRRWHISLSSWMMDYAFTPLSFLLRDRGRLGAVLAITITFLAVGIWHGANWNFVLFGALQSLYFIPAVLWGKGIGRITGAAQANRVQWARRIGLFLLLGPTFILLRAADMHQALGIWRRIFSTSTFHLPDATLHAPLFTLGIIVFFIAVEWVQRERTHGLQVAQLSALMRRTGYAVVFLLIFFLGHFSKAEFIYFQF